MKGIRLKTKFIVLLLGIFVVSTVASILWTSHTQQVQMENELREKAEVLSLEMKATWNFLAEHQDYFSGNDYSATGSYQGLHCAVVGRTIGRLFTNSTDYVTRYVNFDPRNLEDEPDAFEAEALTAFLDDRGVTEYYAISEYDGRQAFRFLSSMELSEACLNCHGEPKGELDVTGHPKEGWHEGDVGGAISITVPMESYLAAKRQNVIQDVILFAIISAFMIAIAYIALSYLVTRPLGAFHNAFENMRSGELGVSLPPEDSSLEMSELVFEFNSMTDELEQFYAGLETAVEDRSSQLERANEILEAQRRQLEEANALLVKDNQFKSDFLAMMSHELRTPLTSIISYTEMLKDEEEQLGERGQKISREIEANSRSLLLMINDILEMSRLDAGRTQAEFDVVDLCDLLGFVEAAVSPIARQNGIELTTSMDAHVPVIVGDFDKLAHVLENLLFNAVKFTPEGGSVRLHVHYDEASDQVLADVIDNGIGIAPEDQERIFERFVQADQSISRRFSGTGLGLPLALEYAEMHGGTVTVESELGKGSTFTVHLPRTATRGE